MGTNITTKTTRATPTTLAAELSSYSGQWPAPSGLAWMSNPYTVPNIKNTARTMSGGNYWAPAMDVRKSDSLIATGTGDLRFFKVIDGALTEVTTDYLVPSSAMNSYSLAHKNVIKFSPDGEYLVSSGNGFIWIWKRNAATGKYEYLPNAFPTAADGQYTVRQDSLQWAPNGSYFAFGINASPYIIIIKRVGDTFTKLPNPGSLPVNYVGSVAWSTDSTYLGVGHWQSPYVIVYKRSNDSFSKLATPSASLPSTMPVAMAFSTEGNNTYLACILGSGGTSPHLCIFKRSGDTFTRLGSPARLPANVGSRSLVFNSTGTEFYISSESGIYVYKVNSATDTFTGQFGRGTALKDVAPGLQGDFMYSLAPLQNTEKPDLVVTGFYHNFPIILIRQPDEVGKDILYHNGGYPNSIPFYQGTAAGGDASGGWNVGLSQLAVTPDSSWVAMPMSVHSTLVENIGSVAFLKRDQNGVYIFNSNASSFVNDTPVSGRITYGVDFSPSGTSIALCGGGANAIAMVGSFNTATGEITNKEALPVSVTGTANATVIKWSPDGNCIAVGYNASAYLDIFRKVSGSWTRLTIATNPGANVHAMDWTPDSSLLAVGVLNASTPLHLYEVVNTTVNKIAIGTQPTSYSTTYLQNNTGPFSVSWSPDGQYLAWSGVVGFGTSGSTRLYSRSGTTLTVFGSYDSSQAAYGVAWPPYASRLYYCTAAEVLAYLQLAGSATPNYNRFQWPGRFRSAKMNSEGEFLIALNRYPYFAQIKNADKNIPETFTRFPPTP